MKILFVTTSYPRFEGDGTAPFVNSIAKGMANAGNEIFILAPYDTSVEKTFSPEKISLFRFKYFPIDSWHIMGHSKALKSDVKLKSKVIFLLPFFIFFQLINSLIIIKRENIDLIYSHWVVPNGFSGAILKIFTKKKLLISLHGSDIFLAKKHFLIGAVTKFVFNISDRVTACSEDLFNFAKSKGAKNKVKLIPWGADPNIFFPAKAELSYNRKPFVKGDNELYIITIGRLVYKKGFDVLINACKDILRTNKNIKLIIGGSGDLETELIQLSNKLGISDRVLFWGKLNWDEVVNFLRIGDIFVLPSIIDISGNIDGLPTVLLEAMATGIPIIASDIGGVSLVVDDDENGLLFTPGNQEMLEKKLLHLIENPSERIRLGINARKSIIEKFNWNSVSIEILNLIDDKLIQYEI